MKPLREAALEEALRLLKHDRDDCPRTDPLARHLSIAITEVENALLRCRAISAGVT